jgi:hypothetical protein
VTVIEPVASRSWKAVELFGSSTFRVPHFLPTAHWIEPSVEIKLHSTFVPFVLMDNSRSSKAFSNPHAKGTTFFHPSAIFWII